MPDHKANHAREKRGFELLRQKLPGFCVPTPEEKLKVLQILGVSKGFINTFDAVRLLNVPTIADASSAQHFELLELKTTDKYLPHLPQGFFFGMTENEEMLLKVLNGKYWLCFVSLHPESEGFSLCNWNDLQKLIQTKRVQYQINLITPKKRAKGASQ